MQVRVGFLDSASALGALCRDFTLADYTAATEGQGVAKAVYAEVRLAGTLKGALKSARPGGGARGKGSSRDSGT